MGMMAHDEDAAIDGGDMGDGDVICLDRIRSDLCSAVCLLHNMSYE